KVSCRTRKIRRHSLESGRSGNAQEFDEIFSITFVTIIIDLFCLPDYYNIDKKFYRSGIWFPELYTVFQPIGICSRTYKYVQNCGHGNRDNRCSGIPGCICDVDCIPERKRVDDASRTSSILDCFTCADLQLDGTPAG